MKYLDSTNILPDELIQGVTYLYVTKQGRKHKGKHCGYIKNLDGIWVVQFVPNGKNNSVRKDIKTTSVRQVEYVEESVANN